MGVWSGVWRGIWSEIWSGVVRGAPLLLKEGPGVVKQTALLGRLMVVMGITV